MSTVYITPEAFGLTTVGEVEWRDEPYEFDMTAVWRDSTGRFYWADDSGCSCPSPFEGVRTLDDLTSGTFHELAVHLTSSMENATNNAQGAAVELLARARSTS